MTTERPEPSPLDYQSPRAQRPHRRAMIVAWCGAVMALLGIIVFLCAHAITAPAPGVQFDADNWRMQETLWGALGIAILLGGTLIVAIGLSAWCRKDAG